jgi:hypothetical protein
MGWGGMGMARHGQREQASSAGDAGRRAVVVVVVRPGTLDLGARHRKIWTPRLESLLNTTVGAERASNS